MLSTTHLNYSDGEIILIDKPIDWTSFDVTNKIKFALKRNFGKIKIGHAGTLDPRATGLLILCTGKKTKSISEIQDADKEYTGSFFLGATTECFDTEKEINQRFDISTITEKEIYDCASSFIGTQEQTPPIFSAVKVDGKRAYDLARQGKEVTIKSKTITIKAFEIIKIAMPIIEFRIVCTKGTYIRSIANDFGKQLNNGAYLHSLCRTKIGNYQLESAFQLQSFIASLQNPIQ